MNLSILWWLGAEILKFTQATDFLLLPDPARLQFWLLSLTFVFLWSAWFHTGIRTTILKNEILHLLFCFFNDSFIVISFHIAGDRCHLSFNCNLNFYHAIVALWYNPLLPDPTSTIDPCIGIRYCGNASFGLRSLYLQHSGTFSLWCWVFLQHLFGIGTFHLIRFDHQSREFFDLGLTEPCGLHILELLLWLWAERSFAKEQLRSYLEVWTLSLFAGDFRCLRRRLCRYFCAFLLI